MRISEITSPLDNARLASLERNVKNAQLALQRERDRQQRERSAKRLQRLQQPKPV